MRVAIDATALPPQPVGAGNYTIQLVRALHDLRPQDVELWIIAQPHGQALIDPQACPELKWVLAPPLSPARRLAWEQTRLPGIVRAVDAGLLHSLHYTRPLRLPCASVVTFHDLTFFLFPKLHTRFKRLFFPLAMRYSARTADALIAISESTRQDAIRILRIPPEKIQAIPLGVNPAFHPVADPALLDPVRRKYGLPERFLLYVGLVEPRKNLPQLIRAYHRLLQAGSETPPLVIVGRSGWQVEAVHRQVADLDLAGQVHFCGYVPIEDLPIVYNLATIFVYPSLYEGFGLPPLEALACGTPVVTTAVSSMPEHIGPAGLLTPPQDEEALSQALRRLLDEPGLRQALSTAGPQQAAQFTWTRTAQQTLQVYRRILMPS